MNIVLIGCRCSGKTEVGKILAGELEKDFLDTDELIEGNAGCSIERIIAKDGWDYFHEIEKSLIEEVSKRDNMIIATGGGVVMDGDNVKNLKENAWIVWLDGKLEVLRERMNREQKSGKIRPSLTGVDPLEEIKQVLDVRIPFYKKAANFVVDTSNRTLEKVAASITNNLPRGFKG